MIMLYAFDEYPVENFHSLLRAQCNNHESGDMSENNEGVEQ